MNLKSDIFFVAYRVKTKDTYLHEDINCLKEFRIIKSPCFCWSADPFPFIFNDRKYIFAEIASTISGKGKIGVICLDDKKPKWKIISKEKFHMSFPNIISINNNLYILPETYQDRCLALYELDKDLNMSKYQTLNRVGFCVDTIYIKDSLKYYFSYESDSYLFDNCQLVWRKFSDSSVVTSLCDKMHILRPAGNAFLYNNRIIMPSQDCREIYGGGIIFNEVSLNETKKQFLINNIFEITPEDICKQMNVKNAVGCHTYNFYENLETIDILIRKFSVLGLLYKIINRFKKS